jgi:hypothetical protein
VFIPLPSRVAIFFMSAGPLKYVDYIVTNVAPGLNTDSVGICINAMASGLPGLRSGNKVVFTGVQFQGHYRYLLSQNAATNTVPALYQRISIVQDILQTLGPTPAAYFSNLPASGTRSNTIFDFATVPSYVLYDSPPRAFGNYVFDFPSGPLGGLSLPFGPVGGTGANTTSAAGIFPSPLTSDIAINFTESFNCPTTYETSGGTQANINLGLIYLLLWSNYNTASSAASQPFVVSGICRLWFYDSS